MPPAAIGQAAAYEAYNTWLRNSSMYEVVGEDRERQREGLVGIAVAEVTRLLQYSAHQLDRYAQSVAADAAAHTVTMLFYQGQDDYPLGFSRMRSASFAGSQVMDPADALYPRPITPSRSRSRSRSLSRFSHRHYSTSPSPHRRHRSRSRLYDDYYDAGPIPGQMSYASSYAGYPSSQAGYHTPYNVTSMAPNPIYPPSYPTPLMPTSYPGQPMAASTSFAAPHYNSPTVMTVPSRRHSFAYPAVSYPGTAWSAGASVPTQAPTVVIMESKRKHRHHKYK
ncbi:hypothetical protein AX15_004669 [Amanita polypyramis BW_CC]|nr:hypothetical protein AX15_004669 [Amanita polypyramis BW_CC]